MTADLVTKPPPRKSIQEIQRYHPEPAMWCTKPLATAVTIIHRSVLRIGVQENVMPDCEL